MVSPKSLAVVGLILTAAIVLLLVRAPDRQPAPAGRERIATGSDRRPSPMVSENRPGAEGEAAGLDAQRTPLSSPLVIAGQVIAEGSGLPLAGCVIAAGSRFQWAVGVETPSGVVARVQLDGRDTADSVISVSTMSRADGSFDLVYDGAFPIDRIWVQIPNDASGRRIPFELPPTRSAGEGIDLGVLHVASRCP